MRKTVLTVLTGIGLLLLVACSEDTWVEVQLDGSDITVSFPLEPSQETRNMNLPGFGDVSMTMANFRDKDISYTVSVMEINDTSIGFNEDNMAPHAMLRKGASLSDTSDVYLGAISGKEYKMSIKDRSVIQRMFVDENKMYTIVTIFKDSSAEDANRFIDSVRL